MKNFSLFALIALTLSALLPACSHTDSRLQAAVADTASSCPIFVSEGVTIDSIDYEDNIVTYYTTISNGILQVETLREENEMINQMLFQALSHSESANIKEQLQMCYDAEAKIVMAFTDSRGDTFEIQIDPAKYISDTQDTK